MRLLVAARLSQVRRGQTGMETQDAHVTDWAQQSGHVVVAVAADTRSGTVQPWDRPNLKPWVTDPAKMAAYDGIVAYRFDRLSRGDNASTSDIERWARTHGKVLLTEDGLQYPNEGVEGIRWDVTARIAHEEWLKTSERYKRMAAWLRANGFLTGKPPWGFVVVPVEGTEHSTIAPDPALVPYIKEMVERALRGDSLASIREWLNAEGVPAVHGGLWMPQSLSRVLRNPSLAGRRRQGNTVLRHQGVIDLATYKRLVANLDSRPKRRGPVSRAPAMLTGVIRCPTCSGVMHRRQSAGARKDGSTYLYEMYRCDGTANQPSTCKNTVPQRDIEAWVDAWFTSGPAAEYQRLEAVVVPGHGHQDSLDQNRRDIAELDIDADDYTVQLDALMAERKRLQTLPGEADRVETRFTGETVREHWSRLSTAQRRLFMLDNEIRVTASRTMREINMGDTSDLWCCAERDRKG